MAMAEMKEFSSPMEEARVLSSSGAIVKKPKIISTEPIVKIEPGLDEEIIQK